MAYSGYALADYHVHPDFSIDAEGSVDEFCQAALNAGLAEVCFTTHFDSDPTLPEAVRSIRIGGRLQPVSDEAVNAYLEAVARANEAYFPLGLQVNAGIEVGWYRGCEEKIAALFARFPFAYKLVGLHDLDNECFCYHKTANKCFAQNTLEQFADKYFVLIKEMAQSGLFDSIAHLDVYRRFGLAFYGDGVYDIHRERIESIFEIMAANGTGYEINTSGFRHGFDQFYPTMDIVNLARSMGVRIAAIGSDAHKPEDVGGNLESAAQVAYELFPYCDE
ncbi:MAG: histidinol-phosphatase HisJ family protein [candidate division Zixibacteria bacterium]|nr:histidinol-phosphatase HisJ family protein [candidate division Zixibacteria bacterium]